MDRLQRLCIVLTAGLALMFCFTAPSLGQSDDADELDKQVIQLYQAGEYAQAVPLALQELALREKTQGPDHAKVADALVNLAELYRNLGRYAEAEPLCRRAIAILEKLGGDGLAMATAVNNLGELYFDEGRFAEAEPLLKRGLAIRERVRGSDHPDVAESLNNLGMVYHVEGRYAEAEPPYRRALETFEKALGPDHLSVTLALNNLAELARNEGRYAEAEELQRRTLAIKEKSHGPDHPDVALTLNNLAVLYEVEGRYADAEPLYKRALAIDERALGPEHPAFARDLNNLADLYLAQERYADAEPLDRRALAIREKALGAKHPQVGNAYNNLALLYQIQGRYADAEQAFRRAAQIAEASLGTDSPDFAHVLNNLARLHQDQGRYSEAEMLYKQSLAIREKALAPEHPDIAKTLNDLAWFYYSRRRYGDAEPLYKRSLAIRERVLGPVHPDVALSLNNLASLYGAQDRYQEALPLVRRTIADKDASPDTALPILYDAQARTLISAEAAVDDSLNVVQRSLQTAAAEALNALAVRFSAAGGRLAELTRQDQDLAAEAASLDKAIVAAFAREPSLRDAAAEHKTRDRLATIAKERDDLGKVFTRDFPDYAALSRPEPLPAKDIQALLADDEALIIIALDAKSYVWAITHNESVWKELAVNAADAAKTVSALRRLLDLHSIQQFDTRASFALYQKILGPVEDVVARKPRLSFVLNGALTSLPPQLLVTRDPAGKPLKDVDWLIRSHAVTVLPSIASLKVLRGRSAITDAAKPLIGFADPVFDHDPKRLAQNARVAADITAVRGIRGTIADITELWNALPPLPETAEELNKVAASVHADPTDIFLGADATEARVKQEKLDQYRIVYFATHGLLAGDVAEFAKLNAEPALVLSLPEHPTEFDDGLLTASEVAQLKLNADWVVLSACNTASAGKPGAEALSGLARAFFYAGARSLVVSNWEVDSDSAVALMTGTFAALAADPKLSHAEALRKSMLAMIGDPKHPEWADPKYWAPFIVVGEPLKPAN